MAIIAFVIAAVISVLLTIVYLTVLWFCFRMWVGYWRSINLPGMFVAFKDGFRAATHTDYRGGGSN